MSTLISSNTCPTSIIIHFPYKVLPIVLRFTLLGYDVLFNFVWVSYRPFIGNIPPNCSYVPTKPHLYISFPASKPKYYSLSPLFPNPNNLNQLTSTDNPSFSNSLKSALHLHCHNHIMFFCLATWNTATAF